MTRPIAYHPHITSSLSKVMTDAPPTVAMMRAMAESRLVPAVSRSVPDEIPPITKPKKTVPSPVRNRSLLLVLTTGHEQTRRMERRTGSQASDEE